MSSLSLSACRARIIVDELIRNGMQDAVLCPGSRSSALALALHQAASADRLRLHVRVDERSAGFLALGLSGETDRPVAVVCTSGSAVANLHPAAVEARYSHRQVVFLTANRPPEMQGVGAQQTINQQGIFAHDVVDELQLSVAPTSSSVLDSPCSRIDWNAHWRAALCRTLLRGRLLRGPVHIDAPFRDPLLLPADTHTKELPAAWSGRPAGQPWIRHVTPTLDLTQPTLVIAGQGSWEIPALAGVPTVVEPGGRTLGRIINPLAVAQLQPRQVVVVGKPTLHRPVTALLARPDLTQVVLAPAGTLTDWADVAGQASQVASTVQTVGELTDEWLAVCTQAHEAATQHCRTVLADTLPSGLAVADVVGAAVEQHPHVLAFVGSSNPVRDLTLTHPEVATRCVVNRGASGIDGTIATAVGIALRHPHPVIALLGDLSTVHDMGSLLTPTLEELPRNLIVVIANDDGGGIFATLEPGQDAYQESFERVFGTPHGVNFQRLTEAVGEHTISYQRCSLPQLAAVLEEILQADTVTSAPTADGSTDSVPARIHVLEVPTSRTDRHVLSARLAAITQELSYDS